MVGGEVRREIAGQPTVNELADDDWCTWVLAHRLKTCGEIDHLTQNRKLPLFTRSHIPDEPGTGIQADADLNWLATKGEAPGGFDECLGRT